jgi:hypothetical protein
MELEDWNSALERWFLTVGLNRPAYLDATEAELMRMNSETALGLEDPAEDLKETVSRYRYDSLQRLERQWEESARRGRPPWLAHLAATVLVVDRQIERGSSAFYKPMSEFLALRTRLDEYTYGHYFHRWWCQLAKWLEEIHAGTRGFPTWRAIPESGPRCVIGHPYTQVLLRREDRVGLDEFLAEFSADQGEPPNLNDRKAAAAHLVSVFRVWVRAGRTVTPHLRTVLESSNEAALESLGYMLLDRLFDHSDETEERSARQLTVVPMFDEFDRELVIAVIAPGWVSPTRPFKLPESVQVIEAGAPIALGIRPTSKLLTEGFVRDLGDDTTMVLQGRTIHALASREWNAWCGVRSVEDGEEVYLLAPHRVSAVAGLPSTKFRVRNLPDGWGLYGPTLLHHATGLTVRDRSLVPRRRGGLALDSASYLVGGEPVIDRAGVGGPVVVDDLSVDSEDDQIDLSSMHLNAGTHVVSVGPYTIRFSTVAVDQPPTATEDVRYSSGVLEGELRRVVRLIPRVAIFLAFGLPGESAVIEATRAPWADLHGLVHAATDPLALSTYPGQDRVVSRLCWVAWEDARGWVVTELPEGDLYREPFLEWDDWRRATTAIGGSPNVAFLLEEDDVGSVVDRWQQYRAAGAE